MESLPLPYVFKCTRKTDHQISGLTLINEDIIGEVMAWTEEEIATSTLEVYLYRLIVAENHRDHKIGRFMHQIVEEWAIYKGVKHIKLEVIPDISTDLQTTCKALVKIGYDINIDTPIPFGIKKLNK